MEPSGRKKLENLEFLIAFEGQKSHNQEGIKNLYIRKTAKEERLAKRMTRKREGGREEGGGGRISA